MPPNDLLRIIDHIPLLSRPSCRARFNNVTTREQRYWLGRYFTTVTVYYPFVRHSLATPIIPTPRARAHAGLMRRSFLRTRNSLWIRKRYRLNADRVRVHRVCKSNVIITMASHCQDFVFFVDRFVVNGIFVADERMRFSLKNYIHNSFIKNILHRSLFRR